MLITMDPYYGNLNPLSKNPEQGSIAQSPDFLRFAQNRTTWA